MGFEDVNKTKDQFIENNCGRGLVADETFRHGDTITSITEPYVIIPENAVIESHCFHCFKEGRLLTCSGCAVVKYCGNFCQKASWRHDHKLECPTFKDIRLQGNGVMPTIVRAVIRVLQNHKTGLSLDPKWARLASHRAQFMELPDRRDNVFLQARMALMYAKVSNDMMSVAIDILCRIEVNGFHITAPDGTPLGLCFEPILSLANHSCVPNAFISCDGRKILLRALRAIDKGNEIKISYIDPTMSLNQRRSILQSHYFFKCACFRCEKDLNVYEFVVYHSIGHEFQLSLIEDVRTSAELGRLKVREQRNSGSADAVNWTAINVAMNLTEPLQRLVALNMELKKHVYIMDTPLLALTPCPEIVHEIFLTILQTGAFTVAFIIQTGIVFNIHPYLFPEPWHPSRVAGMFALYKLLKIVFLEPEAYGVQTLSAFSDNFINTFDALPALTAILSSIMDECAGSFGAKSRFAQEVRDEMEELEKLSSNISDTEFVKIRGQKVEERQKYMKQMKEIAAPEFVMKVIDSVELR